MTNLKSSSRISLDTNILISALKGDSSRDESARKLIQQIKEIKPFVSISVLVIEEFLIHVYKKQQQRDIPTYLTFITLEGLCIVVDVNKQIAMSAAKLRAKYSSLRTPDAIHLASAIESGAKIFFTTDKRLPRNVDQLKIEVLA